MTLIYAGLTACCDRNHTLQDVSVIPATSEEAKTHNERRNCNLLLIHRPEAVHVVPEER